MPVRTESRFGPTLPALLRGLWGRSGASVRIGLAAAAALAIAILAYALVQRLDRRSFSYDGPDAPAFTLRYDGFERADPRAGELARFEHDEGGLAQSVVLRPLRFPPGAEPVSTGLPLVAERLVARGPGRLPGYREALEGRTRLGVMEGREAYMVAFTARAPRDAPPGSALLGKLLLVPGRGERPNRGVALKIVQATDDRRTLEAARERPAAFFLNWPINFWLDLATSVRVPERLQVPLESLELD